MIKAKIEGNSTIKAKTSVPIQTSGTGSSNYNELSNKPKINGVQLVGDKSSEDLGIENYDDTEIRSDISGLQTQIDAITVSSDVVDIVGTYQELQNYDTTKLTDDDIIKVMQDSTHSNAMSYYRWSSNAWVFVESEGPFYTKSESDTKYQEKLVSGENVKTINNIPVLGSGNLEIKTGGGANLTPLEVENNYLDLFDFISNAEVSETYTISNDGDVTISVLKEDTTEDIYVPKGTIISVYPGWSATILSSDGQYTYFNDGSYLYGGVSLNIDEVMAIIDEKLGSDVVMANTEQTILGKKTFTSPNGTIFQNAGGLILKYLSSSPEFKIIPDNNGNFDIYYQNTQLGRIDSNYTTLYRGLIPHLTEQINLGSNTYKFNNIYVKTLYGDNVPKEVSQLITNDNNIIPQTGGILTLGNSTYRWNSLYIGTNINFNPQQVTRIENLKTLSVNLIKLGQQQGSTTTWMDSNFLQLDSDDIKCVGKLLGGLNVNNMAIHNIPDTPDDGTSPINKNYADTNLQGKLTAGTGISITNNVISSTLEGIDYEVDQQLPETGKKGIIYLIPNGSSEQENIYDEYIWIPPLQEGESGRFEFIGTTQTDLTNYVDLDTAQTITGLKTFVREIDFKYANSSTYKAGIVCPGNNKLGFGSAPSSASGINSYITMDFSSKIFYPGQNGQYNLGTSNSKWNNLYLSGNLTDGTNEVAVNKIANKDNFVTLSQSDYDALATKDPDTYYFIEEE